MGYGEDRDRDRDRDNRDKAGHKLFVGNLSSKVKPFIYKL